MQEITIKKHIFFKFKNLLNGKVFWRVDNGQIIIKTPYISMLSLVQELQKL